MNWTCTRTTFDDVKRVILQRASLFPSMIDGFLVDHICESSHYRILIDGSEAGYVSIHDGSLLTQFYLEKEFSHVSQRIFSAVKRLEHVRSAFVPTCDEYFLAHALDEYRTLEKQAYFFNYDLTRKSIEIDPRFRAEIATPDESEFIREHSEDFFDSDEMAEMLEKREVWKSYYGDTCVGFGLIIDSKLFPAVADLGMYTMPSQRQKGYAKLTIQYLINECLRNGLTPVAGCWYYNHNSKKTLEKAGMHCSTRLLKITY